MSAMLGKQLNYPALKTAQGNKMYRGVHCTREPLRYQSSFLLSRYGLGQQYARGRLIAKLGDVSGRHCEAVLGTPKPPI